MAWSVTARQSLSRVWYLQMSDDVILKRLIVEALEQNIFAIPVLRSTSHLPQKLKGRLGKVLVEHLLESSSVEHVGQRAEACLLFDPFVRVSQVHQRLEVTERDRCRLSGLTDLNGILVRLTSPSTASISSHGTIVGVLLRKSLGHMSEIAHPQGVQS